MIQIKRFQEEARCFFKEELILKASDQPIALEFLTPGERKLLALKGNKEHFLLGRAALKSLCHALERSDDTSLIHFPNVHVSLTHCQSYAMAVGVQYYKGPYEGIGIDLEFLQRHVDPSYARFLLSDQERLLYKEPLTREQVIQLWTIKEGCFKADDTSQANDFKAYSVNLERHVAHKGKTSFAFYTHMDDSYALAIALRRSS